jgi:hypothetical protein
MKLTYWMARNLHGEAVDAIVARTRHDCEQKVLAYGVPGDYAEPVKKSFLYSDAFDLFELATARDGGRGMG